MHGSRELLLWAEIQFESGTVFISHVIFDLLLSLNVFIYKMGLSEGLPPKALVRSKFMS